MGVNYIINDDNANNNTNNNTNNSDQILIVYNDNKKSHAYRELSIKYNATIMRTYLTEQNYKQQISNAFNNIVNDIKSNKSHSYHVCPLLIKKNEIDSNDDDDDDDDDDEPVFELTYSKIKNIKKINISYSSHDTCISFDIYIDNNIDKEFILSKFSQIATKISNDK